MAESTRGTYSFQMYKTSNKEVSWGFPNGPVVKTPLQGVMGLPSAQGTKIPHDMGRRQKFFLIKKIFF